MSDRQYASGCVAGIGVILIFVGGLFALWLQIPYERPVAWLAVVPGLLVLGISLIGNSSTTRENDDDGGRSEIASVETAKEATKPQEFQSSEQEYSAGCMTVVGVFLLLLGGWCATAGYGFNPLSLVILGPGVLLIVLAIATRRNRNESSNGRDGQSE